MTTTQHTSAAPASRNAGQGMNWIRKDKRLAIYLRDGLACVWCGEGIECGAKLTLDHLITCSAGGGNSPTNLVTACHRCTTSRRRARAASIARPPRP